MSSLFEDDCRRRPTSFIEGYTAGVRAFAWWEDGEQRVGTCGTSLKDVLTELNRLLEEQRAKPCDADYRTILGLVPIVCVYVLVHIGRNFVVCKRVNEPAKGWWWLPGGQVKKREELEVAAHRVVVEELGIHTRVERLVDIYSSFWPRSRFPGVDVHTVDVVYLATCDDDILGSIRLDGQHSEYRIDSYLRFEYPTLLNQRIRDSKILGKDTSYQSRAYLDT